MSTGKIPVKSTLVRRHLLVNKHDAAQQTTESCCPTVSNGKSARDNPAEKREKERDGQRELKRDR